MREAQEVERLRLALAPLARAFGRIAAELDQSGFVRVQLEAELLQAFRKFSQKAFGVRSILESHDEIVGVADDDHRAACVPLPPLV